MTRKIWTLTYQLPCSRGFQHMDVPYPSVRVAGPRYYVTLRNRFLPHIQVPHHQPSS